METDDDDAIDHDLLRLLEEDRIEKEREEEGEDTDASSVSSEELFTHAHSRELNHSNSTVGMTRTWSQRSSLQRRRFLRSGCPRPVLLSQDEFLSVPVFSPSNTSDESRPFSSCSDQLFSRWTISSSENLSISEVSGVSSRRSAVSRIWEPDDGRYYPTRFCSGIQMPDDLSFRITNASEQKDVFSSSNRTLQSIENCIDLSSSKIMATNCEGLENRFSCASHPRTWKYSSLVSNLARAWSSGLKKRIEDDSLRIHPLSTESMPTLSVDPTSTSFQDSVSEKVRNKRYDGRENSPVDEPEDGSISGVNDIRNSVDHEEEEDDDDDDDDEYLDDENQGGESIVKRQKKSIEKDNQVPFRKFSLRWACFETLQQAQRNLTAAEVFEGIQTSGLGAHFPSLKVSHVRSCLFLTSSNSSSPEYRGWIVKENKKFYKAILDPVARQKIREEMAAAAPLEDHPIQRFHFFETQCCWNEKEKNIFFRSLRRYSRLQPDLIFRELSRAGSNKTEEDVRIKILELDRGMRFLRENHLLLDDTGPVSECEEDNSLNADDDADSQTVGGLDSSILDPVKESGKIPLLSSHSSRVDFHDLFSVFPSCTSVPPEEIESLSVIEETEDTSVCVDAAPPDPGQIMPQSVHIDSLPPLSGASLDPASEGGDLEFAEEESAMIAYCTDAVCCFIERFLHLLLEDPVMCRRKLLTKDCVDKVLLKMNPSLSNSDTLDGKHDNGLVFRHRIIDPPRLLFDPDAQWLRLLGLDDS